MIDLSHSKHDAIPAATKDPSNVNNVLQVFLNKDMHSLKPMFPY